MRREVGKEQARAEVYTGRRQEEDGKDEDESDEKHPAPPGHAAGEVDGSHPAAVHQLFPNPAHGFGPGCRRRACGGTGRR